MPESETFSEIVLTAARSLGAEIGSPWFYFQIGAILVLAGIAYGIAALVRARFALTPHVATWPAPLRLIARVLPVSLVIAVRVSASLLGLIVLPRLFYPLANRRLRSRAAVPQVDKPL